jgi:hypothetical protein
MAPSDVAAAPIEVRMVEVDGQRLRVGVRAGTGQRPPLLIFNGMAPTSNCSSLSPRRWAGSRPSCSTCRGSVGRLRRSFRIASGNSNKEVARALGVTPETVKTHLKNVFEKLSVERRAQAVARARSLGLL